jgi:hypothetical protein
MMFQKILHSSDLVSAWKNLVWQNFILLEIGRWSSIFRPDSSSQAKVPILVNSYLHLGIKHSECNAICRMSFKFDDII